MSFPSDPEKAAIARQRMSDSAKKRFANLEARDKLTAIRLEAIRRPESRAKRSTKMKQHYAEHPEALEAMRERTLQQFSDPEARERHSELTIQQWSDPEKREALLQGKNDFLNSPSSTYMRDRARETLAQTRLQTGYQEHVNEGMKLINSDPLIQQKRRDAAIQAYQEPVKRENLRQAMQIVHADPVWRASNRAGMLRSWQGEKRNERVGKIFKGSTKPTSIEIIVEQLLQVLDIPYESQWAMGRYVVDFYIPSKQLVIECDGDYWHSKPEVQARDARKDTYLKLKGYTILRLTESQIHHGDFISLEQFFVG